MGDRKNMKILEVITDGYEELEAIGTIAILRRAGLDVDLCGIDGSDAQGRYQVRVTNLVDFNSIDYSKYDMLVIPGGPEYIAEERNPRFLRLVQLFAQSGKYIAAICAGPTILGHLGLLKGKNYTCFTSMDEDFGGTYIDQYVVKDGNLITGRSCAASIDFGIEIVRALLGDEKAEELKEEIYY